MEALLAAIERHLPRDPELDPSVVRHDVAILRLAVLLAGAIAGLLIAAVPLPLGTPTLTLVSATILATELAVIGVRWRSLARNTFGRRSAAILVAATGAILIHRVLALAMETSFAQVLVADLLLLSLVYGFAAVIVHRWTASLALVTIGAATLGACFPEAVVPAFVVGSLGAFLVVTVAAFRRW